MRSGRIWATTIAQLKMMFRRRVAIFWSFVFPIILLSLLGLLFGRSIDAGTITVIDRSQSPQATQMIAVLDRTDGVTIKRSDESVAEEQKRVKDGDSDALLVMTPAGSGQVNATLSYSNASATQAGIIQGVVSGAADQVSLHATGSPSAVQYRAISVDSNQLDYLDFLLPGVIAISIMISAVIGLSTVLVNWRKQGILRRLKLTPMPLWEFLVARIAASLVLATLQLVVLVVFGAAVFSVEISPTAWAAVPIALAGTLCFLAMGFTIGSMVAEPETADAVTNVITNPMMFLSGTFFPVAAMPDFVQTIAKVLPLYYLANGLRDTIVRDQGFMSVLPEFGVLCGVTAVLAALSLRTFRWE